MFEYRSLGFWLLPTIEVARVASHLTGSVRIVVQIGGDDALTASETLGWLAGLVL